MNEPHDAHSGHIHECSCIMLFRSVETPPSGGVAQLVEQRTHKPRVTRSIRVTATKPSPHDALKSSDIYGFFPFGSEIGPIRLPIGSEENLSLSTVPSAFRRHPGGSSKSAYNPYPERMRDKFQVLSIPHWIRADALS